MPVFSLFSLFARYIYVYSSGKGRTSQEQRQAHFGELHGGFEQKSRGGDTTNTQPPKPLCGADMTMFFHMGFSSLFL